MAHWVTPPAGAIPEKAKNMWLPTLAGFGSAGCCFAYAHRGGALLQMFHSRGPNVYLPYPLLEIRPVARPAPSVRPRISDRCTQRERVTRISHPDAALCLAVMASRSPLRILSYRYTSKIQSTASCVRVLSDDSFQDKTLHVLRSTPPHRAEKRGRCGGVPQEIRRALGMHDMAATAVVAKAPQS